MKSFFLILIVCAFSFAMAQTASIFAGQHAWYNLSSPSSDVPCEKCHADIAEEMEQHVGPHTGETGYGRMECDYCHRTFDLNDHGGNPSQNINQSIFSNYYYTYASGDGAGAQPGKEAHAASTVPCMYCHSGEDAGDCHPPTFEDKSCICHGHGDGGDYYYYHGDRFYTGTSNDDPGECIKCHGTGDGSSHGPIYIPPAGGFNLTANATDTGEMAAHRTFVMNAIGNPDMEDANEACVACHTKIRVEISFNVTTEMAITVNNSYNISSSYWNVSELEPSNYTEYEGVKE